MNVTINEPTEAPNCVADYIIQYGNETVSTGRNLSVVIESSANSCQSISQSLPTSQMGFKLAPHLWNSTRLGGLGMILVMM